MHCSDVATVISGEETRHQGTSLSCQEFQIVMLVSYLPKDDVQCPL